MVIDERIHPWRWRMLSIWIIVFTALTAYALFQTRNESRRNDKRFCAVTKAFIGIQINIQSELNRQSVKQLGENSKLVRITKEQLATSKLVLKNMPTHPPAYYNSLRRFLRATEGYLETSQDISADASESSRRLIIERSVAIAETKRLREVLKCSDY